MRANAMFVNIYITKAHLFITRFIQNKKRQRPTDTAIPEGQYVIKHNLSINKTALVFVISNISQKIV